MKIEKPFVVLLFTTILVCIFVVIFNFVLRDEFSVFVAYDYPQVTGESKAENQAKAPVKTPERYEQNTPTTETTILPNPPTIDSADEIVMEEVIPSPEPQQVTFPLELNTVGLEELLYIPKVGEVTATRILQYRQELGGYTDISQLLQIKGIGEASYKVISAYVYVAGDDWDLARQDSSQ